MFKLESYITPILLSYVDKYIKNFRPEDSQVSLWGGDASFHNLDLRLEVLEQELKLPFSFVSGHIHELTIHVPWTKLASEPIHITINTIECTLKLRGEDASGSDGASTHVSGGSSNAGTTKKTPKKQELVAPPGYVQSLVNKIVSNITIVCNNLILKYVEEDIVLSLNVRTVTLQSANDLWEAAYTELSSSQIKIRKLINLADLTICLDKRNASGKIELYQEPLLYRCSMEVHLLRTYHSLTAKSASTTRIDCKCDRMDFSLSEEQIPMFMRLMKLALALHARELRPDPAAANHPEETNETAGDEYDLTEGGEDESWAGWAWSWVPSLLPTDWDDDWSNEQQVAYSGHTCHSCMYIAHASISFKVTEQTSERSYYGPKKVKFVPFLDVQFKGSSFELVTHGKVWLNAQMGVSEFFVRPNSNCFCGVKDTLVELEKPESQEMYYMHVGKDQDNYLSDSLFDPGSVENRGSRRQYSTLWDNHMGKVTESSLLERTPALAMDYLYQVDLPEDYSMETLSEIGSDLEYSNLSERTLCRIVIGQSLLVKLCSGLIHRIQMINHATKLYDYSPYSVPKPEPSLEELPPASSDDFDALNEYIPKVVLQVTAFRPTIHFHLNDHPSYDPAVYQGQHRKRRSTSRKPSSANLVDLLPVLSVECSCLDASLTRPMYPRRLVTTACKLPTPPPPMFEACHNITKVKIFGFSAQMILNAETKPTTIVKKSNLSYNQQRLLMPQYWSNLDLYHCNRTIDAEESITVMLTNPKMLVISYILQSLMDPGAGTDVIYGTTLLRDAAKTSGVEYLKVFVEACSYRQVTTPTTVAYHMTLGAVRAFVLDFTDGVQSMDDCLQALVLSGPEAGLLDQVWQATVDKPLLTLTLQRPLDPNNQTHPPLIVCNVREVRACVDPLLWRWLRYGPTFLPGASDPFPKIVIPKDLPGSRIRPSTSDSKRTARSDSVHSSSEKLVRSVEGRTRSDSAKRETVTAATNTSERLLRYAETPTKPGWDRAFLLHWFPVWRGLVMSGDISHCVVYLPTATLSAVGVRSIEEALRRNSREVLVVKFPHVTLRSAAQRQGLYEHTDKLPVVVPEDVWLPDKISFPWTLSFANAGCFTIQAGKELHFLKSVSANTTITISNKYQSESQEKLASLNLCVYVDTTPVKIGISETQMFLMSSVLVGLIDVASAFTLHNTAGPPVTEVVMRPQSPTSPTTYQESSLSRDTPSYPRVRQSRPEIDMHAAPSTMEASRPDVVNLTSLFQWTLARLMVTLYIEEADRSRGNKFKMQLDFEDIMSSLELQDVFKKLKCKVASASIQHFKRGVMDRGWREGTYLGQVMRGNEDISADDESSGFVSLLYTRARSKNVHNKWGTAPNRKNRKPSFTQAPSADAPVQPAYPICAESHYISEIVVKLQAVDFILSPDTLSTFTQALQPLHLVPGRRNLRSHSSPGFYQLINNHTLPLLYVETKAIRVILPSVQMMDLQGVHDVCLIQLESISLAPQAENPLGRVVIRADLYAKAERSRTLTVPGADVEDRQYQLNVSEFSISTGRWEDLQRCLNVSYNSPRQSLKTMSENPAVAWNSLARGGEGITPHIQLTPVIARIKLCIIAAPAIVDRNFILVCGHSLEINSLTDIEVSVSTSQLFLVSMLLKETLELFAPLLEAKEHVNHDAIASISNERMLVITDYQTSKESGMNLDSASFTSPMHRLISLENASIQEKSSGYYEGDSGSNVFLRRPMTPTQESSSESGERNCETIPAEILITAGSIKFVLYEVMDGSQEELQTIIECLKAKETDSFSQSESSSKDSVHTVSQESEINKLRAQPMVYVLLAQPHVFISRHCHEKKAQMSCFDFGIRTSTKEKSLPFPEIPTVADFPDVLLETKNGDPHPTTGIPPSFMTCKFTQPEAKLGKVEIEMGRPMRLNCSLPQWGFLNAVSHKVFECFKQHECHYNEAFIAKSVQSPLVHPVLKAKAKRNLLYFEPELPRSIGTNTSIPEEQESGSFDSAECASEDVQSESLHHSRPGKGMRAEQRFKGTLFAKVSAVAVSTQQIVLHVQTTHDVELMLSLSRLSCSLSSVSGRDRVTGNISLDCLTAAARSGKRTRLLVNPWSCSAHACLAWEPWLPRDAPPQMHLTADSDCFIVDIGPERLRCLHAVWTEYQPFIEQLSSAQQSASDATFHEDAMDDAMATDQEQHYRDDLRAGAFQFVEAGGSREDLPLPYQVVFWQDPPTMAWRYPQPRALTRVDVFPVPFKVANLAKNSQHQQVFCWLQYWSEVRSRFLPYAQFTLSESEVRRLELPGQTVACTWRVQLALTGDDDENFSSIRLSINPKTLAACMRVDSFFSPKLIPQIQAALNVTSIQVTAYNHVAGARRMPEPLQSFTADGLVTETQAVLTGQLNDASLYFSKWSDGRQLVDVGSHVRLDVVDYAYLTQQCVVEPFRAQVSVAVGDAVDVSCVAKPITVRFSSAAAHTIGVSALLWSQALREFQARKSADSATNLLEPQVVLSRYVVCNDTSKSIRFGQAGTDEDILLESRTCHLYAWRSQKAGQLMRVGVEGLWTWCEPFPIDVDGARSLPITGVAKFNLVVKVTSLSSTQKQVTISGQLSITNLLSERFDCRVLEHDQEIKDSQFVIVNGHSTPPTILIDPDNTVSMRIRFSGMLGATWSGDIPLRLNTKTGAPWLVKVPVSERGYIFMWCHVIKGQAGSVLAALYPLYSIRSLLPVTARVVVYTPGLKVYMQTDIKGNGSEQPLYCPGTIDHAHTLTFQLEPAPPTPPVPLSYSMLERRKLGKIDVETVDIQEVIKTLHMTTEPRDWPFAGEDYADVEWVAPAQPETDIRVRYESKGPYCATLQVQIQPWALVLNSLGCPVELVIEEHPPCRIPHLGVLTPPRLEGTFHLGVNAVEKPHSLYRSPALQLHKPGISFYMPRIAGFIPVVGSTQVSVLCGFTVAIATISSALVPEDGEMRVIHLKPNFVMSNKTKHKIRVSCFAVRDSDRNRQLPVPKSQVVVKVPQSESGGTPLVHWKILDEGDSELVPYMMISVGSNWSLPLVANQKVVRRGFSVPMANGSDEPYVMATQERNGQTFFSIHHEKHPHVVVNNNCMFALLVAEGNVDRKGPLVQTQHLDSFSVVQAGCYSQYSLPSLMEKFPTIEQFPQGTNLVFARADSRKEDGNTLWSSGVSISEAQELFVRLPGHGDVKIRIETVCLTVNVTLDTVSHVEISARDIRSRLTQQQFSKLSTKGSPTPSVQSKSLQDETVSIDEPSVESKSVQDETVSIDEPSVQSKSVQDEIVSVDEPSVQSKSVQDETVSIDDGTSPPPSVLSTSSQLEEYEKLASGSEVKATSSKGSPIVSVASEILSLPRILKSSSSQVVERIDDFTEDTKKIVSVNCFIRGFSLTLIENLQGAGSEQTEVTSLSLDNVSITLDPQVVPGIVNSLELILSIGDIQLDNQMFQRGGFDFPVVLTTQTPNREMPVGFSLGIPARQLAQKMVSTGTIYLSVAFDRTHMASKHVKLSVGPIAAYIEDTFLMKLSESLLCFLPHYLILMPESKTALTPDVQIPLSVNLFSHEIANPLRLQSLTIDPLNVLLSIHASLKLYLALDRTPLNFNLFHASQLETTPYRLGHKLTVHYVYGALYGAGWVVGSLELLGSPGGLARTLGSGIKDFVSMPFRGILQGPWGFLSGATQGSASLFRHCAAGAVGSVTGLASSVARNLDRLTLDQEHLQRTEELRRTRPQGIGQGIARGLSGLGINLLGAVGGIAHHPLQAAMSDSVSPRNVAAGVGLGLVGVLTKPLSGAAELVALAGRGLLNGTGWDNQPEPRSQPIIEHAFTGVNSRLKYGWKLSTGSDLLHVVEASCETQTGSYEAVALVLTTRALFLIDTDKDTTRRILSLSELTGMDHPSDPTLLCFTISQPLECDSFAASRARVEHFVRFSSGLIPESSFSDQQESSTSLSSPVSSPVLSLNPMDAPLTFYVNPQSRNYFLTILELAKRQSQGRGFHVL